MEKLKQVLGIVGIVVLLKFTANYLNKVFTRDSAIVKIEETYGIPRECVDYKFQRSRSNPPALSWQAGFCGGVTTDKGSFLVVKNGEFFPFSDERSQIVDGFVEGCTYRIEFFGPGPAPKLGDGHSNKVRKTIYAAERLEPCP